jgi:hypothetical protein
MKNCHNLKIKILHKIPISTLIIPFTIPGFPSKIHCHNGHKNTNKYSALKKLINFLFFFVLSHMKNERV